MESKGYLIRPLAADDIADIMPLCKSFCDELGWPFDLCSSQKTLNSVVKNNWFGAVALDGDKHVGLAAAALAPFYTDANSFRTVELSWHADPSLNSYARARIMILLFDEMEKWADEHNAPLWIYVSRKSTMNFLEKRGYAAQEIKYSKKSF